MDSIRLKDYSEEIRNAILNDKIILSLQAELNKFYINCVPSFIKKEDGTLGTIWHNDENPHPKAKALENQINYRIQQIVNYYENM